MVSIRHPYQNPLGQPLSIPPVNTQLALEDFGGKPLPIGIWSQKESPANIVMEVDMMACPYIVDAILADSKGCLQATTVTGEVSNEYLREVSDDDEHVILVSTNIDPIEMTETPNEEILMSTADILTLDLARVLGFSTIKVENILPITPKLSHAQQCYLATAAKLKSCFSRAHDKWYQTSLSESIRPTIIHTPQLIFKEVTVSLRVRLSLRTLCFYSEACKMLTKLMNFVASALERSAFTRSNRAGSTDPPCTCYDREPSLHADMVRCRVIKSPWAPVMVLKSYRGRLLYTYEIHASSHAILAPVAGTKSSRRSSVMRALGGAYKSRT
ncbi:hypothetical protein VNO77_15277 [Canavalia gladiata]|uniref:Uncharacterized protein n=1 Tax=Canavalia gladiata TaxID=3824 RepID=A0AAN9LYU3_CANGL